MALVMRRFAVEVFGQSMLLHGMVESQRRLTDLVNESEPYLNLLEVSTYPYTPDTLIGLERHRIGVVNKASIVMATELDAPTLETRPEVSAMRIAKSEHRILVYTNQFAINANIHLSPGVEMINFLTISPGRFLPVTNATVLPVQQPTQLTSFRRPFMLINREQISYLGPSADEATTAEVDGDGDTIG